MQRPTRQQYFGWNNLKDGIKDGAAIDYILNQGSAGDANGTFRDGALIIDFPGSETASALLLKFQHQIWHTNHDRAKYK
ncbi:MAG: DUF2278 family protein [Methylobacter sp.]